MASIKSKPVKGSKGPSKKEIAAAKREATRRAKLARELPDYTPADPAVRAAYAVAQRAGVVTEYTPGDGSAGVRGGHTGGYVQGTFKGIAEAQKGAAEKKAAELGKPVPVAGKIGQEGAGAFGHGGSGGRIEDMIATAKMPLTAADITTAVGCPLSRTRAHLGRLTTWGIVRQEGGAYSLTDAGRAAVGSKPKKTTRKGKK